MLLRFGLVLTTEAKETRWLFSRLVRVVVSFVVFVVDDDLDRVLADGDEDVAVVLGSAFCLGVGADESFLFPFVFRRGWGFDLFVCAVVVLSAHCDVGLFPGCVVRLNG